MQNNKISHLLRLIMITAIASLIISCAATRVALEHKNLEAQTKMSNTIFLDPVPLSQKSIYVSVRNTTDKALIITPQLKKTLLKRGYHIERNPRRAHYLLQANILKVGKMSQSAAFSTLGNGYGSTIAGVATGAATGALMGSGETALAGGIVGGLVSMAADSLIKDVNFVIITDIQISERAKSSVKIKQTSNSQVTNGSNVVVTQSSSGRSPYHRYRTRVLSTADKVNLHFAEARPALERGLVRVIAGIF